MVDVHDVAAYILREQRAMSSMKLEKLAYYSQGWHLAWFDAPLFEARIEAWANGPVVRELYRAHRGQYNLDTWPIGTADHVVGTYGAAIDSVLQFYGAMSAYDLSELTHTERPWIEARRGLPASAKSENEITQLSMKTYFKERLAA